jgi:hypothetical protein
MGCATQLMVLIRHGRSSAQEQQLDLGNSQVGLPGRMADEF